MQCAMEENDIQKTAFRVGTEGLFQFTRMPFGLCNGPATYQRHLEILLGDLNYQNLLIYLDILLYSESIEDMVTNLDILFEEQSFKLKPSKCNFFKQKINYLEHT